MIEKSRLEELIKEGATIYYLENKSVCLIFLNKDFNIDQVYFGNTFEYWIYFQNIVYKPLNELYETRKQAEWALNYQHIPRTEELNLPTWEEFKNVRYYEFFNGRFDYVLQYQTLSKKICLYERNNFGDYFCEPPTKENYIKACDLCVKLFKGERDE